MSAQANLIAFDGAATPVSHTLIPLNVARDADGTLTAEYREGLTTVPMKAQVRASVKQRRLKNGRWQVSVNVTVPVMESVSGANAAGYTAAPEVAYENVVTMTGYFSDRATIAERRLVRQLAANVLGGIATSVTPVVTGPAAELIDQNIVPS